MNSFHARQRKPRATASGAPPAARSGTVRADLLLVERGLAASRTAAQRLIGAGRVSSDGRPVSKPAQELAPGAPIELAAGEHERYVSRGGLKLAGALAHTGLAPRGLVCLDLGQSTGGFSDCLLQAGARRVIGIEVGHDQLHARLRGHPDLRCIEGLNARGLSPEALGEEFPQGGFDLLVCDASFISLALLIPRWRALLKPGGSVLALVKPQFEVGPGGLGKGGIVTDHARFAEVEAKIRSALADAGFEVRDWFDSPISGGDGNREFFIHATAPAAAP